MTKNKTSKYQELESLNLFSKADLVIASFAWVVVFGTHSIAEDHLTQNILVVWFDCFLWSVPILFIQRWIKRIPQGIKWLWAKSITQLDK